MAGDTLHDLLKLRDTLETLEREDRQLRPAELLGPVSVGGEQVSMSVEDRASAAADCVAEDTCRTPQRVDRLTTRADRMLNLLWRGRDGDHIPTAVDVVMSKELEGRIVGELSLLAHY